jgi:hypothetical protein
MSMEQKNDRDDVVKAAETLRKSAKGIVLSGHIRNGKVELDQATLDEIARKFGNANHAFIAVNAPFDPGSRASND